MTHVGCTIHTCPGLASLNGGKTPDKPVHATITLLRSQLLHDIRNIAYVEAHLMPEEQLHPRHMTADVGEDGNVDRVTRILDLTHATLVELLYPYTKTSLEEACENYGIDQPAVDDIFDEAYQYEIDLELPPDFSFTSLQAIGKWAHELMVYRALYDWLGMTHPEAAAKWVARATEAEQWINSLKHQRKGILLRPGRPF